MSREALNLEFQNRSEISFPKQNKVTILYEYRDLFSTVTVVHFERWQEKALWCTGLFPWLADD